MRLVPVLIAASVVVGCTPTTPAPPTPSAPTTAAPSAVSSAAPALAFPPSSAHVSGPDVSRDGRGPSAVAGNDATVSTSQVTTYNDTGSPGGNTYQKQVVTQSTTTDPR